MTRVIFFDNTIGMINENNTFSQAQNYYKKLNSANKNLFTTILNGIYQSQVNTEKECKKEADNE